MIWRGSCLIFYKICKRRNLRKNLYSYSRLSKFVTVICLTYNLKTYIFNYWNINKIGIFSLIISQSNETIHCMKTSLKKHWNQLVSSRFPPLEIEYWFFTMHLVTFTATLMCRHGPFFYGRLSASVLF